MMELSNKDQLTPMESTSVIAALAALAQEHRLAVFRLLVQAGPQGMPASRIAENVGIPPSSLSFHLKELTHSQLVTQTKAGRSLIYAANFATMNQLLAFLTENCCGGQVCSPSTQPCCPTTEGAQS
jgi:DNA-binding transcriptional ArsR family regulator